MCNHDLPVDRFCRVALMGEMEADPALRARLRYWDPACRACS